MLSHSEIVRTFNSLHISTSKYWIIHSHASDHFCCTIQYFFSYHNISPVQVIVPNSHTSFAQISRSNSFTSDLILCHLLTWHRPLGLPAPLAHSVCYSHPGSTINPFITICCFLHSFLSFFCNYFFFDKIT